MQYPDTVVNDLKKGENGPQRFARLVGNMSSSIFVGTDYSGTGIPEMVLNFGQQAMKKQGLVHQSVQMVNCRACDCDTNAQYLLQFAAFGQRPLHLFGDLTERLPEDLAKELKEMIPTGQEPTAAIYQAILQKLQERRSVLKHNVAPCILHRDHCPVTIGPAGHPPIDSTNQSSNILKVNIACHTCKGWSGMGGQSRHAHESQLPLAIWGVERSEHREDVVFTECTEKFDANVLDVVTDHKFSRKSLKVCPSSMGWEARRPRSFSCLFNPETMVWVGPTSPQDMHAEFMQLFCKQSCVTSTIFFGKGQDTQEFARYLGQLRSKILPRDLNDFNIPWQELLTPAVERRLRGYKEKFQTDFGSKGAFVCDLAQNCNSKGDTSGRLLGTLLTQSIPYSLDADMPMSPEARCLAMGVPLPPFNEHYSCPFQLALKQLAPNTVSKLIGNAVHGHAFLAFMMYMLSNLAKREHMLVGFGISSGFADQDTQDVSSLMAPDEDDETQVGESIAELWSGAP
jgi:hypothetical protein